jgi:L-ribulose-5-phosphate 4-epimerase
MLGALKKEVCAANLRLVAEGLVIQTWGNVSGMDQSRRRVVIKPSGVPYENMKSRDMVVVDLETGQSVEGRLQPSSDTATHLLLYRWNRSHAQFLCDGLGANMPARSCPRHDACRLFSRECAMHTPSHGG